MTAPGEPNAATDFTIGERYGSNDMYRDLGIISFIKDGQVYTDTVQSVTYSSGEYIPAPKLPWWQKALRAVTPQRLRKPLPMGTHGPPTVKVRTAAEGRDALEGTQRSIAEMQAVAERIAKGT